MSNLTMLSRIATACQEIGELQYDAERALEAAGINKVANATAFATFVTDLRQQQASTAPATPYAKQLVGVSAAAAFYAVTTYCESKKVGDTWVPKSPLALKVNHESGKDSLHGVSHEVRATIMTFLSSICASGRAEALVVKGMADQQRSFALNGDEALRARITGGGVLELLVHEGSRKAPKCAGSFRSFADAVEAASRVIVLGQEANGVKQYHKTPIEILAAMCGHQVSFGGLMVDPTLSMVLSSESRNTSVSLVKVNAPLTPKATPVGGPDGDVWTMQHSPIGAWLLSKGFVAPANNETYQAHGYVVKDISDIQMGGWAVTIDGKQYANAKQQALALRVAKSKVSNTTLPRVSADLVVFKLDLKGMTCLADTLEAPWLNPATKLMARAFFGGNTYAGEDFLRTFGSVRLVADTGAGTKSVIGTANGNIPAELIAHFGEHALFTSLGACKNKMSLALSLGGIVDQSKMKVDVSADAWDTIIVNGEEIKYHVIKDATFVVTESAVLNGYDFVAPSQDLIERCQWRLGEETRRFNKEAKALKIETAFARLRAAGGKYSTLKGAIQSLVDENVLVEKSSNAQLNGQIMENILVSYGQKTLDQLLDCVTASKRVTGLKEAVSQLYSMANNTISASDVVEIKVVDLVPVVYEARLETGKQKSDPWSAYWKVNAYISFIKSMHVLINQAQYVRLVFADKAVLLPVMSNEWDQIVYLHSLATTDMDGNVDWSNLPELVTITGTLATIAECVTKLLTFVDITEEVNEETETLSYRYDETWTTREGVVTVLEAQLAGAVRSLGGKALARLPVRGGAFLMVADAALEGNQIFIPNAHAYGLKKDDRIIAAKSPTDKQYAVHGVEFVDLGLAYTTRFSLGKIVFVSPELFASHRNDGDGDKLTVIFIREDAVAAPLHFENYVSPLKATNDPIGLISQLKYEADEFSKLGEWETTYALWEIQGDIWTNSVMSAVQSKNDVGFLTADQQRSIFVSEEIERKLTVLFANNRAKARAVTKATLTGKAYITQTEAMDPIKHNGAEVRISKLLAPASFAKQHMVVVPCNAVADDVLRGFWGSVNEARAKFAAIHQDAISKAAKGGRTRLADSLKNCKTVREVATLHNKTVLSNVAWREAKVAEMLGKVGCGYGVVAKTGDVTSETLAKGLVVAAREQAIAFNSSRATSIARELFRDAVVKAGEVEHLENLVATITSNGGTVVEKTNTWQHVLVSKLVK